MKIEELKDLIKKLPDKMEVILSKDPEGNAFRQADGWSIHHYRKDGQFVDILDEDDEDFSKGFILWP